MFTFVACDGMTEHVVHEWLADYSALSPVEVHSFASSLEHDQEVVAALYTVLEERSKYQEVFQYFASFDMPPYL